VWGFNFVTMLTWVKPSFGLGTYFRTTAKHILFEVRGRLLIRARNIGTHFAATKTFHSEKPMPFIAWLSRRPIRPSLTFLRESEGLVGRYGGMELRRRLRGQQAPSRSMTF
jgi:hypothetical protein